MRTIRLLARKGEVQNNFFLSIEFFLGVLLILRTKVKLNNTRRENMPPWKRLEIDCKDAIEATKNETVQQEI